MMMMKDPKDRKERIIHARIPDDLDDVLRRKASGLGVSVSNLVRNILQNTFGLVEDIVADSASIARAYKGEHDPALPAPPAEEPRVLGWHEAVLAVNAVCDKCNAILAKGSRAAIAVADRPGVHRFRCQTCMQEEVSDESGR